jgi:hypothetical protein
MTTRLYVGNLDPRATEQEVDDAVRNPRSLDLLSRGFLLDARHGSHTCILQFACCGGFAYEYYENMARIS